MTSNFWLVNDTWLIIAQERLSLGLSLVVFKRYKQIRPCSRWIVSCVNGEGMLQTWKQSLVALLYEWLFKDFSLKNHFVLHLALTKFKPKFYFQERNFTKLVDPQFQKIVCWSGLISHRKKPLHFCKLLYSFLATDDKQIWLVRKSVCLFPLSYFRCNQEWKPMLSYRLQK